MKTSNCRQSVEGAARETTFASTILVLIFCLFAAARINAAEYRAVWVDGFNAGFLNQSQVDTLLGVPGTTSQGQLRDANCNMVIAEVRKRYDTAYPSGVGEPYMTGLSPSNFNGLQAMLDAAHDTTGGKKHIDVHCWMVTFATAGGRVYTQHIGTPTGSLTTFDNYWPTRDDAGNETSDRAFDPGHPLVLQYLVNVCMDLVTNFDIDGIHYDYIRFTARNQGYNPTSIARYNARYGLTGQPAPDDPQFMQWRRDQVSALVRQVYARIQKAKPSVKQSGAFVTWNPSPTNSTREAFLGTRPYGANYNQDGVYSDWDSWMQEGIVDMAVPMTYYDWAVLPDDYTRWMNFEKDRHGNRHMIIGPGIYHNQLDEAILELQMTRDASPAGNHADGYSAYCYANTYYIGPWTNHTYGGWTNFAPRLLSDVNPTWEDIPTMPWKTAPTNGHMMGTVTSAANGAWADGAIVSISGPVNRTMFVDGTGFYAFIDVPPGTYQVTASKAGYVDGIANVTVAIGEVTGNMYEQNFALDPPTPPGIAVPPASQLVGVGSNATFAVTATGTRPLAYQWLFNGTIIESATNNPYTRINVQLVDGGSYSVLITNAYGSTTSTPAVLTVIANPEPPAIATQPQSTNVVAGQTAVFSVTASGTAPLVYQWQFNGTNLSGATASTLTRTNAQLAQAGGYTVVVTNSFGSVTSQVATLTVFSPPMITAQPQSRTVLIGRNVSFSAAASGTAPLSYQWRFQGTALPEQTTNTLVFFMVDTNAAGAYDLVITNNYGSVTSQVAVLAVTNMWALAAGSRPYLTTNSMPNERGMACNALMNHLILVSRTAPTVYVLDADNGESLWTLNKTGITGGLSANYYLLMTGVADDGAVYAGNLTTSPSSSPFKVYRWANDSSNTVPSVAYSGDPGAGTAYRWGDTMDVRGSGANTQIIIGSRAGNVVAVLTTTNGTNFSSRLITVSDAPGGAFGLGLAFGEADTFWGKSVSNALRQVSFNLAAGTGATQRSYGSPAIPDSVAPVGVSTALNLLGGIHIASRNHLRVYDLTATNGTPVLIGTNNFATDNDNTGSGTGSVDFSADTVYALDGNNGLIAVRLPTTPRVAPQILTQPLSCTNIAGSTALFTVIASGMEPLSYQWKKNGGDILTATTSALSFTNVSQSDAASYTVVVTNALGSVTSDTATLTVLDPPAITVPPSSCTNIAGTTATFTVSVTGTAPLSYQWKKDGGDVAMATTTGLCLTNVSQAYAGGYSVVITNAAGAVTSVVATLTVLDPPLISEHPVSVTVGIGDTAVFGAYATGTAPLAFQWRFNGSDITGATSSSLYKTNVQLSDAGSYTLCVTNIAGSATSQVATLTVSVPLRFEAVLAQSGQQILFRGNGTPGAYWVDMTSSFTNWMQLTNISIAPDATFEFVDSITNAPMRFYRIRKQGEKGD